LNIYGFRKINRGKQEQGCYFHPSFRKGQKDLLREVKRVALKGIHNGLPPSSPPRDSSLISNCHYSPVKRTTSSHLTVTPDAVQRTSLHLEVTPVRGFTRKDLFPFSFFHPIYDISPVVSPWGNNETTSLSLEPEILSEQDFDDLKDIFFE
jgi:hypothetical protein